MTEEMKAHDAARYVVLRFERNLFESVLAGETDPAPISVISTHAAEGEAQKAASDAALADELDRTFAVYQQVGTAKAARKVTWEGAR